MKRCLNKHTVRALSELSTIAEKLLASPTSSVFCLYGPMGAGKTTLVKALCSYLGVKDTVSSPTYGLVNEYRDQHDRPIYHFDFYRIKNEMEAVDIGAEDYFYSGNICFIEWPEKIPHILPEDSLNVKIEQVGSERVISW